MNRKLQKRRKLNRAISFMLILVMVATMLPLFSMPKVYASGDPEILVNGYERIGDSYKITDISFENFKYGDITAITLSTNNTNDEINVTTTSNIDTAKSHYTGGVYHIEFNSKLTAEQAANFVKSNVIINPSFSSSDSHVLTIKATDAYGSTVAAVTLENDSTIGTTADKPYKVFTADDLKNIGNMQYSVLMNDITLPADVSYISLISGCSFDGQGYTITLGSTNSSLFGEVQGTIKNVNVVGTITCTTGRGIVATWSNGGTFEHVTSNGSINRTQSDSTNNTNFVGGIVGCVAGTKTTTFKYCVNNATVTGSCSRVGGICGATNGGAYVKYDKCINNGAISGKSVNIGGIAGTTQSSDQISYCYNYGSVTGIGSQRVLNTGWSVGGIIGESNCPISNCYNEGAVFGYRNVGGIVGGQFNNTITNCTNRGSVRCDGSYYNNVLGYYTGGIYGWASSSSVKAVSCKASGTITPTASKDIGGSGYVGYYGGQNGAVSSCSRTTTATSKESAASTCGVVFSNSKFTYKVASSKVSIIYMDYNNENVTNKNAVFAADNLVAPNSAVTLASTASSPAGGVFVGWSNDRSAEDVVYNPGQSVTLTQNLTLYPVFQMGDYITTTFSLVKKEWVVSEKPNYDTSSLNIVSSNSSNGVAQRVFGENPEAALKVILTNSSDKVTLYQLAEVRWDLDKSIYEDVAWNDTVKNWFKDSEYKDSEIVVNPLLLSDMTTNLENKFFTSLFSNDTGVIKQLSPFRVNTDATDISQSENNGSNYYTRFEHIPAGIYAVAPEAGYSPVVVSIVPYLNGPGANWYLDSLYVARLKHSGADVNKWINENDISDTIAYNDTVKFDIDFTFSSLYKDRVTLTGDGTDKSLDYKLYAVDTMSPAYEIINTDANKPTISYSTDGGANKAPLTKEKYSYYEFADASYESADEKSLVDNDNYETYLYNGTDLLNSTVGSLYAILKSDPIYTIAEPIVAADGTTTINITFNAHALKAFVKNEEIDDLNNFVLTLHYEAVTTDRLEIGSDDNTNRIVLNYEGTPHNLTEAEDVVYGYSYGLQVIKIDGTNSTEESKIYLPDARFKLYKEVATKPTQETDIYEYDDDVKKKTRYFVPVTNIFTESDTNLEENGEFISIDSEKGIILKGLKEGNYILTETLAPRGYNSLAEDIYFEINKLEKTEAENHYGGRYKIFKEMNIEGHEPTFNESGMVSLSVFNYKGITLPSTGGAGTLLFTIVGIVMMLSVMIILIAKKQAKHAEYYM